MQRNIWHSVLGYPDILVGQYVVPNFVSNSVSIRLSDNEFILYSPGESLLKTWPFINSSDLKLHILIPNAYHYLGINAWQKQFPNITLYSSDVALKQLIKKKIYTRRDTIHSISELKRCLPNDMDISEPAGHRAGDVWLTKYNDNKTSLWITCDSFLNYDRVSNQPVARLMQKILGAAPGLKMSQVVKWFILDERKEFKRWVLEKIITDKPTSLIPSHGEVLHSAFLGDQLTDLLLDRL